MKSSRFVKALMVGLLALFIGALLCELVVSPADGHRIDFKKLPPAAQAIANERPGVPISSEQWKRLDKVMAQHGGWPSGGDVFLASVRTSWYLFLLLPALGLAVLLIRWKRVFLREAVATATPSLLLLLYALSAMSPMLKA